MDIISHPSPNYNERANAQAPSYIMLHYTGMKTSKAALERLCDPHSNVSAHYTIDEDGTIYEHVAPEMRAWHAGAGYWRGLTDMNSAAIGIELVNPGHEFGYHPYPDAQIDKLISLLHALKARFSIPPENIIAHSDYAPQRKEDPGELFPWAKLAAEGGGVWPQITQEDMDRIKNWDLDAYVNAAHSYGYDPNVGYEYVLRAFERHFAPELILGTSQDEGVARARLAGLLRLINKLS